MATEHKTTNSPVDAARAVTPHCMLTIRDYDAIEIHPCCAVGCSDGKELIETCEPDEAQFWSVYGHCVTGGLGCFEDFPTEQDAEQFANLLRETYSHLTG